MPANGKTTIVPREMTDKDIEYRTARVMRSEAHMVFVVAFNDSGKNGKKSKV